jgi:hypothetical protein
MEEVIKGEGKWGRTKEKNKVDKKRSWITSFGGRGVERKARNRESVPCGRKRDEGEGGRGKQEKGKG